jgi:hypothetical protein
MAEERTAAGDGQQGAKDLSVDVLLDLQPSCHFV